MSHEGYHEPVQELSDRVRDMHRAIESLREEFEVVDWYNQRVATCKDPELREILQHNANEEKEHAVMTLEWIRRRDPKLDEYLRTYLFTSGSILAIEEGDQGEKPSLVDKAMDKATEVATGLAGKLGQNVSELVTQALEGPAKPARKHPAKRK